MTESEYIIYITKLYKQYRSGLITKEEYDAKFFSYSEVEKKKSVEEL